jgi:glycosyltransferase involved in cell wall biosynthesis
MIVTTHPIQYFAPLYREIAKEPNLEVKVIFASGSSATAQFDAGFGESFRWDIPLTDGYQHAFLDQAPTGGRFGWILRLFEHFRGFNPDFVMVSGYATRSELVTILYSVLLRKRILFRPEATDDTPFPPRPLIKGLLREVFIGILYKSIHAALAIGTSARTHFLQRGVAAERIFWSPYSADVSQNQAMLSSKSDAKHNLGIDPSKFTLLFCGKLIDRKDPRTLIESLKLYAAPQRVCILIVGSGPNLAELQKLASANSNCEIRFCGFKNQTELPAYYAASDAIVLPSRFETWGLVINEAMAFGCIPIVSNNVGCRHDLVATLSNNLIFPVGNARELANAIEFAAIDSQRMHVLQEESKKTVQGFSFRSSIQGILNAIRAGMA